MELQHTECSASVWPHRHTDEMGGPLDIKISFRNQPPIVRDWPKKSPVKVMIAQPDERTNLTMMQFAFYHNWFKGDQDWYNINQCRLRHDGSLKLYLKSRIIKSVSHPIPRGKWDGSCVYDDKHCVFTFQAMTMKVQPKDEPQIILPDGSLPAKKNIKLVIP